MPSIITDDVDFEEREDRAGGLSPAGENPPARPLPGLPPADDRISVSFRMDTGAR